MDKKEPGAFCALPAHMCCVQEKKDKPRYVRKIWLRPSQTPSHKINRPSPVPKHLFPGRGSGRHFFALPFLRPLPAPWADPPPPPPARALVMAAPAANTRNTPVKARKGEERRAKGRSTMKRRVEETKARRPWKTMLARASSWPQGPERGPKCLRRHRREDGKKLFRV